MAASVWRIPGCEPCGLNLGLEFIGLSPGCSNLRQAAEFVERAKRSNIGIGVDAIHLHLTGGKMADLASVPAEHIAYAQLCDTESAYEPAVASSAELYLPLVFARSVPGKGIIPLAELIGVLPRNTYYDVEVPWPGRQAYGISAEDHARRSVDAALALLSPDRIA